MELASKLKVIYGAQSLTGKILSHKELGCVLIVNEQKPDFRIDLRERESQWKAERMKEAGSFWESMGERGFPSVSFGPRENAHRG